VGLVTAEVVALTTGCTALLVLNLDWALVIRLLDCSQALKSDLVAYGLMAMHRFLLDFPAAAI
jgi:hypothetical protein